MNENNFKLWRLALSAIHFDGKVSSEEKAWFAKKIKTLDNNRLLDFTDEQVSELQSIPFADLSSDRVRKECLCSITDLRHVSLSNHCMFYLVI